MLFHLSVCLVLSRDQDFRQHFNCFDDYNADMCVDLLKFEEFFSLFFLVFRSKTTID